MDVDMEKDKAKAPARGVLASKYKPSSILKLSSVFKNKTTKKFLPFLVPVTTTSIGRISGYVTMAHVASSALGTLDMAAHQIAISIFCCLSPLVDALNTVAQSFVPSIFARPKSKQRALALRKTSLNFAKVGALAGLLIVTLVVGGIPSLSKLFTTDSRVLSRVTNAIPGIAITLGFDGLMSIGEGTLLGHKDLKYLRNSYACFFFLVPAFMLRLKRKALNGIPVGLGALWGTFTVYQIVRTTMWLARVAYLQWKTESETSKIGAT
jgi:Na+-driven multidrug efflux pump